MSVIDWKKYIWSHYKIGSILDLPYKSNTYDNIRLLGLLGTRQHKNPDSMFVCKNIDILEDALRFKFPLADYKELEFQFRTYLDTDIVIIYDRQLYNISIGDMTFGEIIVFMLDVFYLVQQRCKYDKFDMFDLLAHLLEKGGNTCKSKT